VREGPSEGQQQLGERWPWEERTWEEARWAWERRQGQARRVWAW